MALNTVSSDRLSTNVKNTNFTSAEKQDLTNDILPLAGQLGNRNLIINGAMNVAQRGTSSTGLGASAGYFTLDRYRATFSSTAGRLTMSQVADVHDGFANAMKLECTTADTSIGSSEYFILQHKFEGQDVQQLKKGSADAEEFTVSFYVKGNANATYVVEMYDLDNNRQVGKTFSVTTSWTRVVLTFPADTTGALDDDNAASLQLGIWLHAGSNYTSGTLATSWVSNVSAQRAGGITSFFDSTDRTFFLTGLQMEVGSVATDFEHRSFAQELALCQRYYQTIGVGFITACRGASSSQLLYSYTPPVNMRASPTISTTATGFHSSFGVRSYRDGSGTSDSTTTPATVSLYWQEINPTIHLTQTGFSVTDDRSAVIFVNGGAITLSAEL